MVTLNEHDALPQRFVEVQLTEVVPVTKVEPDAGVHETVPAGVPNPEGSVQVTTWLSHCVISAGQVMVGVSLIVTVKEHWSVPHELVAVHVTVVTPALNVEPETGEQTTEAAGTPVAVGSVQVAV